MIDTYGSVWPECRFKGHARSGLVMLDADMVKDVDRRSISGMANAIRAIVRPHEANASLVVWQEGLAAGQMLPGLISEADTFSFGAPRARYQQSASFRVVFSVRFERAR